MFAVRVREVLDSIRGRDETIAAVAHGGVIGALCSMVVGRQDDGRPNIFRVGNCSLTEIVADRTGRLVLLRQNDTCHLEELTVADLG